MKAVGVAALMNFSLAPSAIAQDVQTCPPKPGLGLHSRVANGTSIRWYSGLVNRVDLKGNLQIVLVPNPNDERSVHVRLLALHEEGQAQDITGSRFVLELAQPDDAPESTLRCSRTNPSTMTLTYVLNLVLTASSPDGSEVGHLRTKNAAVQSVELKQWPPKGELFRLQGPMEFIFPDSPDEVRATFDQYPTQEHGDLLQ